MMRIRARPYVHDWSPFIAEDYSFVDFPSDARVLDIGFGEGKQMRAAAARGCRMIGVEYDPGRAFRVAGQGFAVCRGSAERLPFAEASFDGVICKVVLLLTDEARSVAEIARVLRPGGTARISYHGAGYSLRYLVEDPDWKRKIYGARTLVNTALYRLTGRRLPGFLGDTLFQSAARLRRYYAGCGLDLIEEHPSPCWAGAPVFIYHTVRKRGVERVTRLGAAA